MLNRRSMPLAALAWLACTAPAFAESVRLFRVFLNDGTAIVSYGEYARVGDRLVFSMPIGAVDASAAGDPSLHVVNLPVSSVNLTATEKYAESARHTPLPGEQRRVRLRGARWPRRVDAERYCAGERPEGAAGDGDGRSPPPRHLAERPLRIPSRRCARDVGIAGRSDLRPQGGGWRNELHHRPHCDSARRTRTARPYGAAQGANRRRINPALDRCGEGHRHCGRSGLDSSRRHCGDR